MCVYSLEVVGKCVRCCNGHGFCADCAGWCAYTAIENAVDVINDDDDDYYDYYDVDDDDDDDVTMPLWVCRVRRLLGVPVGYRLTRRLYGYSEIDYTLRVAGPPSVQLQGDDGVLFSVNIQVPVMDVFQPWRTWTANARLTVTNTRCPRFVTHRPVARVGYHIV